VLPRRRLLIFLIPPLLLLVGTVGYRAISAYEGEPWSLLDCLYMTVITLTTVGYAETHPLSPLGRVFTICLLLGGVVTFFAAAAEMIRWVVSGELHAGLEKRRMQRDLAGLSQHVIVCGFGRMGRYVCAQLSAQGLPFVVIERDDALLENFRMSGGIALAGDATLDEVLLQAGVPKARALITVAASDADNLYITMSARLLNDRLYIVARADEERAEQKLTRAGANRVVSPYVIGGARVAQAVLRPTVVDFIELATRTEHLELQIEEARVEPGSRLDGRTLRDSQVRQDLGLIVVAIKKASGQMLFNPAPDAAMGPGDILIALGHRTQLDRLAELAAR
jgi:voltage-gated potassium channel